MRQLFPHYPQMDRMDCGPACLRMIAHHYGRHYSLQQLRQWCHIDREGVSLKGIALGAERIGLRTQGVLLPFNGDTETTGLTDVELPVIVHWNQNHFVVVYRIDYKQVWIADPARGKVKLDHATFFKAWKNEAEEGIALLLEKGQNFAEVETPDEKPEHSLQTLFFYLQPFRRLMGQVGLGLVLGALLSLVFPFLTQAIVDIGIQNQDINFIFLILVGQLFLFASQTVVRFIQNWILLHIGTRMNVALVSDFLAKLTQLPLGYFDTKMTGDLLQRIGDHQRIERFLTQSTLSVLFSVFNLVVFSVVMLIYSVPIFLVFLVAAVLYTLWIVFFLRRRRQLDYQAFHYLSKNQDVQIELIQGMQEIKLQGSHLKRRWQWAEVQARLFRVQLRALALGQWQEAGAIFFMQLKDIIITVMAAGAVINGEITLGMMLAIQYINGQLSAPVQRLIAFIREAQDARISLERLTEVQQEKEEHTNTSLSPTQSALQADLVLRNVHFRYNELYDWVLDDLSLTIPHGKVTAIVGASGSGKTTLLKLLLGFYHPQRGDIRIGDLHLQQLDPEAWRAQCGAVMQDGFIFSDTIANNIAESDEGVNFDHLAQAIKMANLSEFIQKLPIGLDTIVGARGNGLSQGQRQRLLIARAVYKQPHLLIFDEATNALDANNERQITEQLQQFYAGRTVIIVAHRLSTVQQADQIVVLEGGKIVEQGTHQILTAQRGAYYTLVKNQLELGN